MCAIRKSCPFISACPLATTAPNWSRKRLQMAVESTPAGAATAVSAAAGELGANSFSPSASTPARVMAAHHLDERHHHRGVHEVHVEQAARVGHNVGEE